MARSSSNPSTARRTLVITQTSGEAGHQAEQVQQLVPYRIGISRLRNGGLVPAGAEGVQAPEVGKSKAKATAAVKGTAAKKKSAAPKEDATSPVVFQPGSGFDESLDSADAVARLLASDGVIFPKQLTWLAARNPSQLAEILRQRQEIARSQPPSLLHVKNRLNHLHYLRSYYDQLNRFELLVLDALRALDAQTQPVNYADVFLAIAERLPGVPAWFAHYQVASPGLLELRGEDRFAEMMQAVADDESTYGDWEQFSPALVRASLEKLISLGMAWGSIGAFADSGTEYDGFVQISREVVQSFPTYWYSLHSERVPMLSVHAAGELLAQLPPEEVEALAELMYWMEYTDYSMVMKDRVDVAASQRLYERGLLLHLLFDEDGRPFHAIIGAGVFSNLALLRKRITSLKLPMRFSVQEKPLVEAPFLPTLQQAGEGVTLEALNQQAALNAVAFIADVERVLAAIEENKLELTAKLSVSVRAGRRLAKDLGLEESRVALILQLLFAGLFIEYWGDGPLDSNHVAATEQGVRWLECDFAERWALLLWAWLVTYNQADSFAQLRVEDHVVPQWNEKRMELLITLLSLPLGTPYDSASSLAFYSPVTSGSGEAPSESKLLELLGLTVDGVATGVALALAAYPKRPSVRGLIDASPVDATAFGATLEETTEPAIAELLHCKLLTLMTENPGPEARSYDLQVLTLLSDKLRAILPATVDKMLVQGDLTITVPGLPSGSLTRVLNQIARLESLGGAWVYRLTEALVTATVRRGMPVAKLQEFFETHTLGEVPQALTYMFQDITRRAGGVAVFDAASVVVCDDPNLIPAVVKAVKGTLVGENVVISGYASEEVGNLLAQLGVIVGGDAAAPSPDYAGVNRDHRLMHWKAEDQFAIEEWLAKVGNSYWNPAKNEYSSGYYSIPSLAAPEADTDSSKIKLNSSQFTSNQANLDIEELAADLLDARTRSTQHRNEEPMPAAEMADLIRQAIADDRPIRITAINSKNAVVKVGGPVIRYMAGITTVISDRDNSEFKTGEPASFALNRMIKVEIL